MRNVTQNELNKRFNEIRKVNESNIEVFQKAKEER
jgi:hypothetical protein